MSRTNWGSGAVPPMRIKRTRVLRHSPGICLDSEHRAASAAAEIEIQLGRNFSSSAGKEWGLKRDAQTTLPPRQSCVSAARTPRKVKFGVRLSNRSLSVNSNARASSRQDTSKFVEVSGTNFGRPVVDEVNSSNEAE